MRSRYPKYFYIVLVITPIFLVATILAFYCGYVSYQAKNKVDMRIEGDWPIEADEVLGFVAAKNASTLRRQTRHGLVYNLFTDKRGARVNSHDQHTLDQVEILTVGGSFSWGHGMENEKTFTELLGRTFEVPVANFAYGSYGTVQAVQLLERNIDLAPRVIIYGFIEDHRRRNVSPCAPSYAPYCLPVSYVAPDENGSPQMKRPVRQYSSRTGQEFFRYVDRNSFGVDDVKWGAKAIVSRIKRAYAWKPFTDSVFRRKSMSYLMERMTQTASRSNALLIVVHIPRLERESTNAAPSELVDALGQETLFIDLSDKVRQHYANPDNPLLRFERDNHPNEIAHEMIAREISNVLRARGIF